MTVLTLDEALPETLFNELMGLDFVRHAHQVKM
jgi:hypothetical protein